MHSNQMSFLRASAPPREIILCLAPLFVLFLSSGCTGDGSQARYTVTGKVTHQGQPVENGTIQFENPPAGQSNSSPLGSGGAYSLEVPAGEYKVTIIPPTIMTKGTGDSPPDEIPDPNVKNIPKKYRVIESSGLTAQVDKDKRSFDFELK
jgi:hypothetical protein